MYGPWFINHIALYAVPTPIVSVVGSNSTAPFNGTVYNLTGAIQLDTNIVDTAIIATWEWSRGGQSLRILETVSPYYQSVLTFQPLATNSSGEYRLSVTLRSENNTVYIIQNRASITYSMSVLRKYYTTLRIVRCFVVFGHTHPIHLLPHIPQLYQTAHLLYLSYHVIRFLMKYVERQCPLAVLLILWMVCLLHPSSYGLAPVVIKCQ